PQPATAVPTPTAAETPAKPVAGPKVVVEAVEIDGNKIFVAGLADTGRKVRAYANDILLGDAVTSPDGHFLVEATRDIPVGQYTVRVDALEADGVKVAARATVPFEREPGEAISAVAPDATKPAQADTKVATAEQPAAEPASPAASEAAVPETVAPKLQHSDGAVIIRRGDSLWRISRRVYGHGIRYSTIYLANQEQISDPDRIWPGQVFKVPEQSKEGEPADLKAMGDQATTTPAQ
ncbi:MAG: LysM peptidoglycan-binding domain-containing protein, partial [Mesorhizobium sp.]